MQETLVECAEKPDGTRVGSAPSIDQMVAMALQFVQLRHEVTAGISAVEQLRTEMRELNEQMRQELVRQAGETRQLIQQTRQEMRVLQEHSLSRIASRLGQR